MGKVCFYERKWYVRKQRSKTEDWPLEMTNQVMAARTLSVQMSGHKEAAKGGRDPTTEGLRRHVGTFRSFPQSTKEPEKPFKQDRSAWWKGAICYLHSVRVPQVPDPVLALECTLNNQPNLRELKLSCKACQSLREYKKWKSRLIRWLILWVSWVGNGTQLFGQRVV